MSARGDTPQASKKKWYWCKETGCVMFPVRFELLNGQMLKWYIARGDCIRDVIHDINVQTDRDIKDLYFDCARLHEDMTYNEVIFLYVRKQMQRAEGLVQETRIVLANVENILKDVGSAVSSTIPREPSTEPESESVADHGTRDRSRSPRNRATVESVSSDS